MSGAFSYHGFIACSSSRLVPSYRYYGTQGSVQSMRPIFMRRDLNIEHEEMHGEAVPQKDGIMFPEICKEDAHP
jgi:hypothetical protein